jgi:hypothetical protein
MIFQGLNPASACGASAVPGGTQNSFLDALKRDPQHRVWLKRPVSDSNSRGTEEKKEFTGGVGRCASRSLKAPLP